MLSVLACWKQLFPPKKWQHAKFSSHCLFLTSWPFVLMTSPATKMPQTNSVNSFQCCWPWHSTVTVSTQKMAPFFGWKQLQSRAKANNIEKSWHCLFVAFLLAREVTDVKGWLEREADKMATLQAGFFSGSTCQRQWHCEEEMVFVCCISFWERGHQHKGQMRNRRRGKETFANCHFIELEELLWMHKVAKVHDIVKSWWCWFVALLFGREVVKAKGQQEREEDEMTTLPAAIFFSWKSCCQHTKVNSIEKMVFVCCISFEKRWSMQRSEKKEKKTRWRLCQLPFFLDGKRLLMCQGWQHWEE